MALPKTLFVKEEDFDGEPCLITDRKLEGLAETKPVVVGEYQLVRKVRASLVAKIEPAK